MAELMDIPLGLILPSPFQMRSHMDADKLDQLGESLKRDGQQRPVKVRPLPDGEYELVFGHRAVSVAKQAGFETVKAIIEDLSDEEVMLAQYAENEYREDISDYDRARWLQAMIDHFGYTQTQLADKIGQNQPWISHHLAILKLDGIMAHAIISNMTEFQARAILRVPEDLLSTVCREVEEHCEAHGELPSTSMIASIVQSIEVYSDMGEDESVMLPAGTPRSLGVDEPSEALTALMEAEVYDEVDTEVEPEVTEPKSSAEKYIADYINSYQRPDLDYLAWEAARRYRIPEEYAHSLIKEIQTERQKSTWETGRTKIQPEMSATCTCPLCGRGGADRNLILMNVENPDLAQQTLEQFITEALKR